MTESKSSWVIICSARFFNRPEHLLKRIKKTATTKNSRQVHFSQNQKIPSKS